LARKPAGHKKDPFPAQQTAQEWIKSDEMIHVGMGDEPVGDLEEVSGRQAGDVSEVENQSASLELERINRTGSSKGPLTSLAETRCIKPAGASSPADLR
jgi:hypothetical protein